MRPPDEDFGSRLAFDRGAPGRRAVDVPAWDGEAHPLPDAGLLRDAVDLPELSQPELVRYWSALAGQNYGVESGFYPLGSCTMKYNPKVHEVIARLPGFAELHPLAPAADAQGMLACLWELQEALAAITGLRAVSLAPAAGAQGELAGMLMVKQALAQRGELDHRRRVLVPDSAHGTNPASAAMAGFEAVHIATGPDGTLELPELFRQLDASVAALMITIPNTLGLWEPAIAEVAAAVHAAGGYVYGDGANLNAVAGRIRFGDLGIDVAHLNLHKTFSTPHGGGGPGCGPVCAGDALAPYLPAPIVARDGADYVLQRPPRTIGRLQEFHGSAGVALRALAYIRTLGLPGLRAVSENAVINANYLRARLREHYDLPYDRPVLHEVVFSGSRQRRASGVRTTDIAKRLIDYGFHPPTVYFPLIVEEALMIEPTETESRETLDAFVAAMAAIAGEAEEDVALLQEAPHTAPLGRLDEATAARRPELRWRPTA